MARRDANALVLQHTAFRWPTRSTRSAQSISVMNAPSLPRPLVDSTAETRWIVPWTIGSAPLSPSRMIAFRPSTEVSMWNR